MSKKANRRFKKDGYPINLLGSVKKGIAQLIKKKTTPCRNVDAPTILGGNLKTVTSENTIQLQKAFEKGGLVGVLDATPGDIEKLYTSLGLTMEVDQDMAGVDFFGMKRETTGIRQVTFFAPPEVYGLSEERVHINADGSKTTSDVEIGTIRMFPDKEETKDRAKELLKQIGDIHHHELTLEVQQPTGDDNNIIHLAESFRDQKMYPIGVLDSKKKTRTNYFQVTTFAYACYSQNNDCDWYYVYQIGQFNPSNGFFKNAKRQRGWYADIYRMNAWPTDFRNNTSVSLIKSSPNTTTGAKTATSSVSYSISGGVSYSDKGGQASVSGGMSISNSLSVSIPDISVLNKSIDQVNNAHWEFRIPKATGKEDGCINDLNGVAQIAHNTFQPENQWIWRAESKTRDTRNSFRISSSFFVELINTYMGACNIFGCNCDVNHQKYTPYPKGIVSTFRVPFPPKKK